MKLRSIKFHNLSRNWRSSKNKFAWARVLLSGLKNTKDTLSCPSFTKIYSSKIKRSTEFDFPIIFFFCEFHFVRLSNSIYGSLFSIVYIPRLTHSIRYQLYEDKSSESKHIGAPAEKNWNNKWNRRTILGLNDNLRVDMATAVNLHIVCLYCT